MLDCQFRVESDEAYSAPFYDAQRLTPTKVWLCNWPEAHPQYFIDAPPWLQRRVYPGLAIEPEHDCKHCPARKP